jgi:hypothetical protein
MSRSSIKWVLLASYMALAFWFGMSFECVTDSARPLVISLSVTLLVYINICFFLKLPINLLHLPEAKYVSNFSLRRKLVLISWVMFLILVFWGLVDDFGCSAQQPKSAEILLSNPQ